MGGKSSKSRKPSASPLDKSLDPTALYRDEVDARIDRRRPQSRRINEAWMTGGGPTASYMLEALEEDDPSTTSPEELTEEDAKIRAGSSVRKSERAASSAVSDSEHGIVYVVPSGSRVASRRVSRRMSSARNSHGSFNPHKSSQSQIASPNKGPASFSLADVLTGLPTFAKSCSGAILGRSLGEQTKGRTADGRKFCQDEIDMVVDEKLGLVLVGLFDGHGSDGHAAAASCAAELRSAVLEEYRDLLPGEDNGLEALVLGMKSLTRHLEEVPPNRLDLDESGTTATVVLCSPKGVTVANVGDSRAVAGSRIVTGMTRVQCLVLSEDHVFENDQEALRVEQWGGVVEPVLGANGEPVGPPRGWLADRTKPGIMVSRSLGDRIAKRIGVTADPYTTFFPYESVGFVVVASDGLWEVMSSEDVVGFVASRMRERLPDSCVAEDLVLEAKRRWIASEGSVDDDVSAVVVILQ